MLVLLLFLNGRCIYLKQQQQSKHIHMDHEDSKCIVFMFLSWFFLKVSMFKSLSPLKKQKPIPIEHTIYSTVPPAHDHFIWQLLLFYPTSWDKMLKFLSIRKSSLNREKQKHLHFTCKLYLMLRITKPFISLKCLSLTNLNFSLLMQINWQFVAR